MLPNLNHQRQPLRNIDLNVEVRTNIQPTRSGSSSYGCHNQLVFDLNFLPDEEPNHFIDLNSEPPFEDSFLPPPSIGEEDNGLQQAVEPRRKFLHNEERQAIYEALLQRSINGTLQRDTTKEVALMFSVSIRSVQRIWQQSKQFADGEIVNVCHKKNKNCGRKKIEIDINHIREIPLNQRTTIRSLAGALNKSKTSVSLLLKSGELRRHTNAIKPYLKDENRKARLKFCISMIEQNSLYNDPKFVDMFNVVHIDEKWFFMSRKTETYYLLNDEEDPMRMSKSKNFIPKVMFLAAIARPRFDTYGNETFSGKIGIFPFVFKELAKRNSVNRIAGTIETKAIPSINREIVKSYMIEKILPAIQARWPADSRGHIFIQQDNCRTHIDPNDREFNEAAISDGFDIRLMCQPPNFPDLNVLDLGFFRAIQSLQQKCAPKTIDELVFGVEKSFEEYLVEKSNFIFLNLQLCMIEIMKCCGSNKYKIPHINKERLQREGRLPVQVNCDPILVQNVLNLLAERDQAEV